MKILLFISRVFVGALFVFSGFVKAVDPLGSNYKFVDYFGAFGMDWMYGLALPLSMVMSAFELIVGLSLLFNVRIKQGAWGALIFMAFFTPLTFYLALANPVKDCGCFGDALILDNWQTFYKNLIILVPTLLAFYKRKDYQRQFNAMGEWLLIALFVVTTFGVSIFSYQHLPIIDFRPYKVGTDIPAGMRTPEGAPLDEYRIVSIYEKDGEQKEFVDPEYPDATWTWVSTDSELIKKGYETPIHDFMIENKDGYDLTNEILSNPGYTFMLVAYDLNKTNTEEQEKINDLAGYCMANGHDFICLTSSSNVEEFRNEHEAFYEFFTMDEITLKTIIRANPGLVLIKEGTILSKFHFNDVPSAEELGDNLLSYALNQQRESNQKKLQYLYILAAFLTFSLLLRLKFLRNKAETDS